MADRLGLYFPFGRQHTPAGESGMIKRLGRQWRGARIVAWAIVYALVFQVVLTSAFQTSALFASRASSTAPGLFQICQNDPSTAEPHGPADDRTTAFVHCPLCLSRVDLAILPTPPATPVIARLAVLFRFQPGAVSDLTSSGVRLAHRPRGPPIAA
ncbi:DUF2946 family protein [Xanthobacter sp. VTT E-85241]|uniref:DUF2946 family protein n=1 Tax=Roseixanthobacter finlandensis TaxID=3119922 RepID=UPI00372BC01A